MDNTRFDALVKAFGGRGTRRAAIAGAMAVFAGRAVAPAIAQQSGEGADCLQPGERCDNNQTMWWRKDSCKLCCSGFPKAEGDGWACACTPKGGGCGQSIACCGREECYYGVCGGPSCMPEGGECGAGKTACCEGLLCDPYGWCKPDPSYVPPAPTAAPEAPVADAGTVPVGVSMDSGSTNDGGTDTADAGTDTADSSPSTDSGSASAGASGDRECRPAGRGCTLAEQCCSGSCGIDGSCA